MVQVSLVEITLSTFEGKCACKKLLHVKSKAFLN